MSNYATVANGLVTNVILWDGVTPYPDGVIGPLTDDVGIGWTVNSDGTFTAPLVPVSIPPEDDPTQPN